MNAVEIVQCSDRDLDLLAKLNKQLIEDEKHDNPMDVDQLRERMGKFITTDYNAYYFMSEGHIVGYALVNRAKTPLYLRQFFICREHRRKGYGAIAFKKLMEELNTTIIDVDVLTWNEGGRKFWNALGFKERSVYMRHGEG